MTRDPLTAALLGDKPIQSDEEIANGLVQEWQQEATGLIRATFGRMRRHLDGQSAVTAAKTGDPRQAQAIAKRLAIWVEQERQMIEFVQSSKVVDEARRWVLSTIERGPGNVEAVSIPKLSWWPTALRELSRSVFPDTDDDALFRECLRQSIAEDAAALGAAPMDDGKTPVDEEAPVECLITLQQAAAMVNRSKRSLERLVSKMPMPRVQGTGGRPSEWAWSELRPWLEQEYGRPLPDRFPADRVRPV